MLRGTVHTKLVDTASALPVVEASYLFVAICFMYALLGLGNPETAKKGNFTGIVGMIVAITYCVTSADFQAEYAKAGICFIIAAILGISIASRAEMIMMPQLVAGFHAMVGLAAVCVAYARYFDISGEAMNSAHLVETLVGVFFGAITFTGSIVACGKLHGTISSKPLCLPFRHAINAVIILISVVLTIKFCGEPQGDFAGSFDMIFETIISGFLGWHLVMSIGGADMPVVVSMLNSYSGWTTVAAGFMLDNDLLIIAGSLIGSSGAILSYIMCRGMNRSFISVILGGFGVAEGTVVATGGEHRETNVQDVCDDLLKAKSVIIVPGYGMAVARCQQSVAQIAEALRANGTKVRFAIHPVAGRLPGHMNVLLAEANVPYDIVEEMEKINEDFTSTDVSIVCGANDIVNPLAVEDLSSPIGGMPVLEVWKAKKCIVMKRSMATGYAGIDNPLFYKENAYMLFGNAKDRTAEMSSILQTASKNSKNTSSGLTEKLLSEEKKIAENSPKEVEYPPASKVIGVLNETSGGDETRVAISPSNIPAFRKMGFSFVMESGAGLAASLPNRMYLAHGGIRIVDKASDVIKMCDILIKIKPIVDADVSLFRPGQIVVGYIWPSINKELTSKLAARQVTALAVDSVPRITRAQKLDTLSSMANMAGYKAVVEAFHLLPRFSKPLTTAAGSVPPSTVFVIGAGVAGLSAIGTARSIGAVVKANDTRSAVKEQVESMGAEFLPVPFEEKGEGAGGYAKVMSREFQRAQMKLYADVCKTVDVVITTAQIPGKPAPTLVTKEMVRQMRPGSVIVDLAAQQGGNCELTVRDKVITDPESGVVIVGITNMACYMPLQASELFATNMRHLFGHMGDATKVDASISSPDEVIGPIRVSYQGKVTWEPPKAPSPPPAPTQSKPEEKKESPVKKSPSFIEKNSEIVDWFKFVFILVLTYTCVSYIGSTSTSVNMVYHSLCFVLSVIIGYFLVWSVDAALHTPLMSVTNAISGIIVVGGLLQLHANSPIAQICAILGTFCASVNIFGGFFITQRMLKMFRKI